MVVNGALYVRAYLGINSSWHQAAMLQKTGRIKAAGITKEVSFKPVSGAILERIDDAYKAKYKGSKYLSPMIGKSARAATVKIIPRNTGTVTRGEGPRLTPCEVIGGRHEEKPPNQINCISASAEITI